MNFIFGTINARRKIFHSHEFHDGTLMFSRHLTLCYPFLHQLFIYLFYSFFILFGYELVCEWLVPITMYGDENKDG